MDINLGNLGVDPRTDPLNILPDRCVRCDIQARYRTERMILDLRILVRGQPQVFFQYRANFPFVARVENVDDSVNHAFRESHHELRLVGNPLTPSADGNASESDYAAPRS